MSILATGETGYVKSVYLPFHAVSICLGVFHDLLNIIDSSRAFC